MSAWLGERVLTRVYYVRMSDDALLYRDLSLDVQRSCRKAPSPLRKRGDTMRYDAARYDTGSATSDPATSETTSPSSTRHQPSAVWVRHCLFGLFRCITLVLTDFMHPAHPHHQVCRGPVSPAQERKAKQAVVSKRASLGLLDGTNPLMTARCKRGAQAEPSLTRIRISMDRLRTSCSKNDSHSSPPPRQSLVNLRETQLRRPATHSPNPPRQDKTRASVEACTAPLGGLGGAAEPRYVTRPLLA